MEKDDEMKGDGNSYTTLYRQYDPRIGRWLSLDPLADSFPHQSGYAGMDNSPIYLIDPYGDSTFVVNIGDGKYSVVGGNLEGEDKGVYVVEGSVEDG